MKNPFVYGKVVSGEYYFPRPALCVEISKYVVSHQPILILGPRRYGKSSFLGELSNFIKKQEHVDTVFIDLLPITSTLDFLETLKRAIGGCGQMSWWNRGMRFIKENLAPLRPYITMDSNGELGFSVAPRPLTEDQVKREIRSCLDVISHIGETHSIAIFMDEFQQIAQIDDGHWLERALRTAIQRQQHVSYVYCGSRRSLLRDMFQNEGRAFYQQANLFEFPKLTDQFADWMVERFQSVRVSASRESMLYLLKQVGWNPNFAQLIGHHIVAAGTTTVGRSEVDTQLNNVVEISTPTYINQYDALSPAQKRLIRALAHNPGVSPYSAKIKQGSHLSSGQVQAGLKTLKQGNLIEVAGRGKGRVKIVFDDPLFEMWLTKKFFQPQ